MASFSHFLFPIFPLTLFLIFLYKWLSNAASTARKRIPPSPKKLPIIGNLHQLGLFPHKSLQSLSKDYGPLMLLHLGRVPVLVASSADAAREIMKNQDSIFSNRPKLSIADKLFYGSKDIGFSQYGEYWRQVRGICVLQLLSNKRVQSFRRVREEETSIMIEKIKELGSLHSVINLSDILVLLTNDILCRVALGRKYSNGEEGTKFKKLLVEEGELLGAPSIGDYVPWLAWINRINGVDARAEKVAREMDEFLEGVVEEHRTRTNGEMTNSYDGKSDAAGLDFVDILLEVQRQNKDSSPLGNDSIKAIILVKSSGMSRGVFVISETSREVCVISSYHRICWWDLSLFQVALYMMDIFTGGTDTTFTALEWTMAELLRHPRTMQKLQSEVRQIAQEKEEITEDDLDKMHYLKAVIKETLRLRSLSPLLIPRESTQDTKIMGYGVAAGTRVFINAWAIARDPSLWENPEDFNPERFLSTGLDFKGMHFEFIPFGAGRRGCPGITFAMAVNELALAKLVHKFNFKLPEGESEEDLDMTEVSGITVHKKYPLLVVTTPYTYGG